MTNPHIIELSRFEWNSKLHRVEDVSDLSMTQATMTDNINQFPNTNEDKPFVGVQWAELGFTTQISGSGTAGTAPKDDLLYKACGLKHVNSPGTSDTYSWSGLTHTDFTALAVDWAIGNTLKQSITGMAGTAVFQKRPGMPERGLWSWSGLYAIPTEAALSSALDSDADPVVCKNLVTTLNTVDVIQKEVDIDLSVETNAPNENISASNGVDAPDIIKSGPPITRILMELPALSALDFLSLFTAQTKITYVSVLGTSAGNIITDTVEGFMISPPVFSNLNGILMVEIVIKSSTESGDTAFARVYT